MASSSTTWVAEHRGDVGPDLYSEYDCNVGAHVAIMNFGNDLKKYKGGDEWTIKPRRVDGNSMGTTCGSFNGFQYEHAYENGECDQCPVATMCVHRSYCDFDPKSKS